VAGTGVLATPLSPPGTRSTRARYATGGIVVANQRMMIYGVGAVLVIILIILFTR